MNTLLATSGLKKYFPVPQGLGKATVLKAVDDVTLTVNEGENLGLVGESGSGKTTLARLIARLHQPDAGGISFDGRDVVQLSRDEKKRFCQDVQMVFQDPYSSLDPRFSIYRVLAEALVWARGLPLSGRREKMVEMLNEVGLCQDILSRYPHEFSGGERQRIAIARALLLNPRLLILDEAVSSLDVLIQGQIVELLKSLQARHKVTYLFVTHNLRVVRKLCPRIAVMFQGKIVELASADDILTNPFHPYTKRLLSAALSYRAPSEENVDVGEKSHLLDRGGGHFVID